MTIKSISTLCLFAFVCSAVLFAQSEDKRRLTIGVVHDGFISAEHPLMKQIESELTALLGSKYDFSIPEAKLLSAAWSADQVAAQYQKLADDGSVDGILGLGVISSAVIALQGTYPKPVLVLGLIDPEPLGLAPLSQNFSGIPNFNYILTNRSISRDVELFYRIVPYQNIGIIFFDEVVKRNLLFGEDLQQVMDKQQTKYAVIPVKDAIDEALNNLQGIDAAYVGYLGKFEGPEKVRLIEQLTQRGIPTFGFSVSDAEQGALAAASPQENMAKVARRIALNVEAGLNGEDLAKLTVHLSFEETLTLNMATARKLNFSPDFSILTQAELLNEFEKDSLPMRRLDQVMRDAVTTNLEMAIENLAVQSDAKEVDLAKTNFLPQLSLSATTVQIDEDRAEGSFGTQAERTTSGTASVEQLVYSEQAYANVTIQKHLLQASEDSREQLRLDIMLEAGESFLNVLAAQSLVGLLQENLNRIKTNLDIAKQREASGYSNLSDVYRWESQLATETFNLMQAKNQLRLTKIGLNRVLNRPLDEKFVVQEITVSESSFSPLANFRKYVRNPHSLDLFMQFISDEAVQNAFEIQQLNAAIAATERSLRSIKRERYVPKVGLVAEADHFFSRSGAGSEGVGIGGMPLDPADSQWYVALSASVSLFKGGEIKHRAIQTNLEILGLEEQKANAKQLIETNVRSVTLDLGLSVANLDLSKISADAARKSYEIVLDAYSKGVVTIVELTDSQTNVLNAETAEINSVYDFYRNVLQVQRAMSNFVLLRPANEMASFSERITTFLTKQTRD